MTEIELRLKDLVLLLDHHRKQSLLDLVHCCFNWHIRPIASFHFTLVESCFLIAPLILSKDFLDRIILCWVSRKEGPLRSFETGPRCEALLVVNWPHIFVVLLYDWPSFELIACLVIAHQESNIINLRVLSEVGIEQRHGFGCEHPATLWATYWGRTIWDELFKLHGSNELSILSGKDPIVKLSLRILCIVEKFGYKLKTRTRKQWALIRSGRPRGSWMREIFVLEQCITWISCQYDSTGCVQRLSFKQHSLSLVVSSQQPNLHGLFYLFLFRWKVQDELVLGRRFIGTCHKLELIGLSIKANEMEDSSRFPSVTKEELQDRGFLESGLLWEEVLFKLFDSSILPFTLATPAIDLFQELQDYVFTTQFKFLSSHQQTLILVFF